MSLKIIKKNTIQYNTKKNIVIKASSQKLQGHKSTHAIPSLSHLHTLYIQSTTFILTCILSFLTVDGVKFESLHVCGQHLTPPGEAIHNVPWSVKRSNQECHRVLKIVFGKCKLEQLSVVQITINYVRPQLCLLCLCVGI